MPLGVGVLTLFLRVVAASLHRPVRVLWRADSTPAVLIAEPAALDRRALLLRLNRLPLFLLLLQVGDRQRVIPFYGRYEPAGGVLSGLPCAPVGVGRDLRLRGL